MITVRFPSGVAVTYNDANDVKFYSDRFEVLHKSSDGKLYYRAAIPVQTGCLIEWTEPCKVVGVPLATAISALEVTLGYLRHGGEIAGCHEASLLVELKNQLRRFDACKKVWKC